MCESSKFHGRRTFFKGMAAAAAVASTQLPSLANSAPAGGGAKYADPAKPALPKTCMKLDLTRTAFVVIDPQIDFMSPKGKAWPVVGESVTEQNMVPNLVRLFQASKKAGITIAISPHYYYPQDHR